MRSSIYLLGAITASFFTSVASASTNPTICTMEYAPVCGSVQVQCIMAPCEPIKQTFSNSCMANAAGATDIQPGECKSANLPPVVVGGDQDVHGCKGSAGYSWNPIAKKCLRPWEGKVRLMTIDSMKKSCTGVAPTDCMQVNFGLSNKWSNFYGEIYGFDYTPGYRYRLIVLEEKVENPPADSSSLKYTLLRSFSKKQIFTADMSSNDVQGAWNLVNFNEKDMTDQKVQIQFEANRYSVRFCNAISGDYSVKNNSFTSARTMSTKMYCEGLPMTLENAWNLDGATYSMMAVRRMAGSVGPTMYMTITTKTGDVFQFGK